MGHRKNQRNRANQPQKEALDTNQDKSVEETKTTQKTEEKEETLETETKESAEEEEKTPEEIKEEGMVEGAQEEKLEETTEATVMEKAPEEAEKEEVEEEALEEKEEEEKKREKALEEEIVEERIYTIPLSRAWISPRKKRTPRAVRIVRSFVQKHMKIEAKARTGEETEEAGKLVISDEVNKKLWSRGIEKPPRKIRIRAVKNKEGTVTLYLAEGD